MEEAPSFATCPVPTVVNPSLSGLKRVRPFCFFRHSLTAHPTTGRCTGARQYTSIRPTRLRMLPPPRRSGSLNCGSIRDRTAPRSHRTMIPETPSPPSKTPRGGWGTSTERPKPTDGCGPNLLGYILSSCCRFDGKALVEQQQDGENVLSPKLPNAAAALCSDAESTALGPQRIIILVLHSLLSTNFNSTTELQVVESLIERRFRWVDHSVRGRAPYRRCQ